MAVGPYHHQCLQPGGTGQQAQAQAEGWVQPGQMQAKTIERVWT